MHLRHSSHPSYNSRATEITARIESLKASRQFLLGELSVLEDQVRAGYSPHELFLKAAQVQNDLNDVESALRTEENECF
jgi:hypothetical protein